MFPSKHFNCALGWASVGFLVGGMSLASNAGPTLVVCRFLSLPLTNETPSSVYRWSVLRITDIKGPGFDNGWWPTDGIAL